MRCGREPPSSSLLVDWPSISVCLLQTQLRLQFLVFDRISCFEDLVLPRCQHPWPWLVLARVTGRYRASKIFNLCHRSRFAWEWNPNKKQAAQWKDQCSASSMSFLSTLTGLNHLAAALEALCVHLIIHPFILQPPLQVCSGWELPKCPTAPPEWILDQVGSKVCLVSGCPPGGSCTSRDSSLSSSLFITYSYFVWMTKIT